MSGCIIITMTFTDGIALLGITERKRAPCNSQGRAHVFPSITPAWTWAPHSVLLKSLRKVPVTLPKTWCQLRAAGVLGERKCDSSKSPPGQGEGASHDESDSSPGQHSSAQAQGEADAHRQTVFRGVKMLKTALL